MAYIITPTFTTSEWVDLCTFVESASSKLAMDAKYPETAALLIKEAERIATWGRTVLDALNRAESETFSTPIPLKFPMAAE